jgi:hypothetical protein
MEDAGPARKIVITAYSEDPKDDTPIQQMDNTGLVANALEKRAGSSEEVTQAKQRSLEESPVTSPTGPRDYCRELKDYFEKHQPEIDEYETFSGGVGDSMQHLDRLIAHVQLAINDLSPDAPIFSVIDWETGRVLRPARILLMPVTEGGNAVLTIARLESTHNFSLHIVNSAGWHLDRAGRDKIINACHDRFKALRWISTIATRPTLAPRHGHSQWSYHWINGAQHTDPNIRVLYVVLNAWALVLGLDINPDFSPRDTFQAQTLEVFNLVFHCHSTSVNYTLLTAFLYCHGYVKNGQKVLKSRKFKSNMPTTSLRRQRKAAKARGSEDSVIGEFTGHFPRTSLVDNILNTAHIDIPNGKSHEEHFRFDNSSDHVRHFIVPGLIEAGRLQANSLDSLDESIDDQYLQTLYGTLDNLPSSTFTSPNTSSPRAGALFGGLSACEYLTREMGKLSERTDASAWVEAWNLKLDTEKYSRGEILLDGFTSVLQAVAAGQSIQSSFALVTRETLEYYASNGNIGSVSRALFPRRILVFPWTLRNHTVLIVVKYEEDSTEKANNGSISIHAIDSGPWRFTKAEREAVFEGVKDLIQRTKWHSLDLPVSDDEDGLFNDETNDVPFPSHVIWTIGPTQSEDYEAEIFSVLASWSIFLGLELNCNFLPKVDFFEQVSRIIKLTIGGYVDWQLITAFLLCHGFVHGSRMPTPTAHFRQSVHRDDFNQSIAGLVARDSKFWESFTGDLRLEGNYKMPRGRPHNQTFRWDDWDRAYVQRISSLHDRYGRYNPRISEAELKRRCRALKSTAGLSKSELDTSKDPCQTFHRLLRNLDNNNDNQAWIKEVKIEIEADYNKWLRIEDVLLPIASVTMAISSAQTPKAGFSILNSRDFSTFELASRGIEAQLAPAIRAGSPMIVPFINSQHIVLLVLFFNEFQQFSITVLDSKQFEYTKKNRNNIYEAAWELVRLSNWGKDNTKFEKPDFATWSRCSQQPEDWLCGYYAILNAWAIALGLDTNPNFKPDLTLKENSNFYKHLQLIIQLSRAGLAEWRVISTFLECYEFVKHGQSVHASRRFSNTIRLIEEEDLSDYLENTRVGENQFIKYGSLMDCAHLTEDNQIQPPQGRQHIDDFSSDGWSEMTRLQKVPDMQEHGWFIHNRDFLLTEEQITKKYRVMLKSMNLLLPSPKLAKPQPGPSKMTLPEYLFKGIEAYYKQKNIDFSLLGHDKMIRSLHIALNHETSTFPGGAESLDDISKDPCTYSVARYNILQNFKKLYGNCLTRSHRLPKIGELLFDEDATFGIASVVEAIDSHQQKVHSPGPETGPSPFSGGFAIAEAGQLSFARSVPDHDYHVMRPRRCWLMPFIVAGEFQQAANNYRDEKLSQMSPVDRDRHGKQTTELGHMFLVVVQEERFKWAADDIAAEFRVYILDSAPQYYSDIQPWLYEQIKRTAQSMHWTDHRNPDNRVDFARYHWTVKVAKQEGGWPCGHHLILNAWILALGLTPNETENFKKEISIYVELYNMISLALDGILDWKTLVSWLLCHNLVQEKTMDKVPFDRRFDHTQVQTSANDLAIRIDNEVNQPTGNDYRLAEVAETEVPYNLNDNVDFTDMARTVMTTGLLGFTELDRGRRKSSKKDWLYRR